MKKVSLLASCIAMALVGCGSDSNDDTNTPTSYSVTAIDGYLSGAQVYIDVNENHVIDDNDTYLGLTDDTGKLTIADISNRDDLKGIGEKPFLLKAIAGKTQDMSRGLVSEDFVLGSTEANVISPITDLVIELMKADSSLKKEDAVAQVKASLASVSDDDSLLFADYLQNTSEEAKALTIIGEQLVDFHDKDSASKLAVSELLAEDMQAILDDDDQDLEDDYYPIINIPSDGSTPTLDSNHRPVVVNDEIEDIEMTLGDAFPSLNVADHFDDKDNETLTYQLIEEDLIGESGLTIDATGQISGELTKAGEYEFEVYAIDSKGAISYPLEFEVEVEGDADLITVDEDEAEELQAEIYQWYLRENHTIDKSLDIEDLFENLNEETAIITPRSTLQKGPEGEDLDFDIYVADNDQDGFTETIGFNDAPSRSAERDAENLYIYASNGSGEDQVYAKFELPKIHASNHIPDQPSELENNYYHRVELHESTNRAICRTYYFDDSESKAYVVGSTDNPYIDTSNECVVDDYSAWDSYAYYEYTEPDDFTIKSVDYDTSGVSWTRKGGFSDWYAGVIQTALTDKALSPEKRLKTFNLHSGEVEQLLNIEIGSEVAAVYLYLEEGIGHVPHSYGAYIKLEETMKEGQTVTTLTLRGTNDNDDIPLNSCPSLKVAFNNMTAFGDDRFNQVDFEYTEADDTTCYLKKEIVGEPLAAGSYTFVAEHYSDGKVMYEGAVFSFLKD